MLVLYVTGHGFGHATRQAAIAAALRAADPKLAFEIRTEAPAWLFTESCPGVPVSRGGADGGMAQKDALEIDFERSLALQLALQARWDALVAEEAGWLRSRRVRLVAGDIPPLAFAAAERAAVRSAAIGNFSWDWIFEPYAAADPRWEPHRRRCADAYAAAEVLLRIPLHGDLPAFRKVENVPLVSRLWTGEAAAWRAERGLSPRKPLVLAAFGGFSIGPLRVEESLASFQFAGFGPKPAGLDAPWLELRAGTSADQLAAMAACDIVLSKPGYGILSEAMAHGKRLLYVPREGFREVGALIAGIEARGACAALPREDFLAGRWRGALDRVLSLPAPAPIPPAGNAVAAARLLSLL